MQANVRIELNFAEATGIRFLRDRFRHAQQEMHDAISEAFARGGVVNPIGWSMNENTLVAVVEVPGQEPGDPPQTLSGLDGPSLNEPNEADVQPPLDEAAPDLPDDE